MKLSSNRRYRRSISASRETAHAKKENQPEQTFFAAPAQQSFFKPVISRKCAHCEAEEKTVQRMVGAKEEEKPHKMTDKKEEEVHRATDKIEEEKISKTEGPKEEVHRATDKEEDKSIAKKEAAPTQTAAPFTGNYIHSLHGKGSPLPAGAQQFFGRQMGYDFSQVKIHTGTQAEQSAKEVNAKAYCFDNNIVFNKGQYNPETGDGKKLLAHELAHVMQQHHPGQGVLSRVAQITDKKKEEEKTVDIEGVATKTKQKTSYGCGGVQVGGQTDANYKSAFKTSGKTKPSEECSSCTAPDCVTSKGNVVSTFKAHPVITLPNVPDGLSKCEAKAVKKFINGTLKQHELQHKTAFKTYDGVIKTPYEFTGCKADLTLLVQSIHDGVDMQRSTDANALSDALDPFSVPIPCNCE